jgi:hypothetical protein
VSVQTEKRRVNNMGFKTPEGVSKMSQKIGQTELHEKTQQLLQGPLKHIRAAALAAALLPLASVAVSPASAQDVQCPSGGTMSGFVWNDINKNGIQDTGEPGIAGAVVSTSGVSIETDANGFYSFDLSQFVANCEVSVQIPPGAQPSPSNVPGHETTDSDGVRDETGANSVAPRTLLPDGSVETDVDFGFFLTPVAQPGTGTPGYWKNHPDAWPDSVAANGITVGGHTYTKAQAIAALGNVGKDKTYTMFSSLVPAMLNLIVGNDPTCVASTIALADLWMTAPPVGYGPVGSGVQASSLAWKKGEPLHRLMDNYNNGMLCAPHRD